MWGSRVNRVLIVLLAGVVVAGGAAWHYRATIKAYLTPPASASNPAENPDVLYSWVDEDGITHFSAKPAENGAKRVEFDGSRITPVDVVEAPILPPEPAPGEPGASTGNAIKDLRVEMEQNAKLMQEAKRAQHDF